MVGSYLGDTFSELTGFTLPNYVGAMFVAIPVAKGLDRYKDLTVILNDAHLDWTDSRDGQRYGNGSPMRRMSEMDQLAYVVWAVVKSRFLKRLRVMAVKLFLREMRTP